MRHQVRSVTRAVWRNIVTGLIWTGFSYGFVPLGLPSMLASVRPGGVLPDDEHLCAEEQLGANEQLAAYEQLSAYEQLAADQYEVGGIRRLRAEEKADRPLSPAERQIWIELVAHLRRSA
jgi:hypothetical protein